MAWGDARLEELRFLAEIDRDGHLDVQEVQDSSRKQMIASLLLDGYLDDRFDRVKAMSYSEVAQVHNRLQFVLNGALLRLAKGEQQRLFISHKGRVRLSELRQQLRTGRDRDETGLLWAKHHLMTDLTIEILSAGLGAPLSLAFLDMNGLKVINDTQGHPAGDEAIRAFFQTVAATLGQKGNGYRNGGDEVVVILPGVDDDGAGKLLDGFVRQLGKDVLVLGNDRVGVRLTASCGSMSTTKPHEDAGALLDRADKVQYRAKDESKKHTPRVSAFAVGDGEVKTHAPSGPLS